MNDEILTEIRDLLREVRDLLLPVSDAHQDEYQRRVAEREAQRMEAIRGLLSTDKRRRAFDLADGTRTQREIAKEVGMDEGGTSRFFKSLRDLGAIGESTNPKRLLEVKQ